MQNIRVDAVNGQYDIKIGSGELKKLASYLAPFHKVLIVTDENVFSHYEQVIKNYPVLVVPAGEHSKSHEILLKIYDELLQSGMTRADAVVAFGGGVVGDLAGFAAASFKRGMQFVQIPTTLLAQVDSSVGGKVGVNLPGGKNMVGAFYQPDLVVADMDQAVAFYEKVLGLHVVMDFGANKTLTGGLCLQTLETWKGFIGTNAVAFGGNNAEIYFEEDDFDRFAEKLTRFDLEYVHPIREHAWGQRVVRFYDPDRHIGEVGENMKAVCRRFLNSGMTPEQVAERMDVPIKFVSACMR